jgi:glycosyltransferase involved in cell wall biosynthesis
MSTVLSIVMPIHNEEACIESVLSEIQTHILSKLPDSVLVAVDDGSNDSTPEILDKMAARFPQIIPFHKENGGHGDAVLFGLEKATGRYIFLMDSDGQTEPKDFWLLWDRRNEADFISGIRAKRYDPLHRLIIARFLRYGITLLFGVRCRDANVPFKLLTKEFWGKARPFIPRTTLIPSLFLCIAAKKLLGRTLELNINHLPRETGTSTIRYLKLLRFCLLSFAQLIKFRRALKRIPGS